jgi:peptidoglycan/xylan/chitin deacetylase (PgdA/CDA1 family)
VEIIAQLDRAEDLIIEATGENPRPLFRPPYGDYDDSVNVAAGKAGYRYNVMWTVDSLGWKGIDPDAVVDRVLDAAGNGAIVLMHVGAASTDLEALQDVIDGIREMGLELALVEDIL